MEPFQVRKPRKRRSRHRLDHIPRCVRPRNDLQPTRVSNTLQQRDRNQAAPGRNPNVHSKNYSDSSANNAAELDELPNLGTGSTCEASEDISGSGNTTVERQDYSVQEPLSEELFVDAECYAQGLGHQPEKLPPSSSRALAVDGICADENEENAAKFSGNAIQISNWRVLWALVMTNGGRRVSKCSYQSIRNFLEAFVAVPLTHWTGKTVPVQHSALQAAEQRMTTVLPHYSTLHKTYKPRVLSSLAVRAIESFESVDLSKAGARSRARGIDDTPHIPLRTILPSEYARADVSSLTVWSAMRSTSLSAQSQVPPSTEKCRTSCVDTWPVVCAREWFYGPKRVMHVDNPNSDAPYMDFAEVGDVVEVHLLQNVALCEPVLRCFGAESTGGAYRLRGEICHTWNVRHTKRAGDQSFKEEYKYEPSSRDQSIAAVLSFCTYISPSDSINVGVPGLPVEEEPEEYIGNPLARQTQRRRQNPEILAAKKRRQEAIKERKRQEDAAWKNWRKPLLKPGDFVVLLRPCAESRRGATILTDSDRLSRLVVVHRFWTEMEEKWRHVLWIPGGRCFDDALDGQIRSSNFEFCDPMCYDLPERYLDVRQTSLLSAHGGERGPENFIPISSEGELCNGELYFIYRFVLFWDGFQLQAGTQASGEGVYMLCLNLPPKSRASPHAVRVLSLTPPGVSSSVVLNRILPDIIEGMTTGFLDIDGDGKRRRIFLDLVGCLGDTPALNSALDVLGHTAAACCHLCRFTQSSDTLIGSRYSGKSPHGFHSSFSRGFFEHAALHDCNATQETCRPMGVKANIDLAKMPLHLFREARFNARGRVPESSTGIPLLPHHWDPYRSCFIAPDHLCTGHLRDCITLAYRLLPNKDYRLRVERYMLSFLDETGLPAQQRLFDHDKKALYTMSMTEIYALAVVAELAFLKVCCSVASSCVRTGEIRDITISAIALVGSCANLIVAIWRKPELRRDGPKATKLFQENNGQKYIAFIQNEVENHLARVCDICKLTDSETMALEDPDVPASDKAEISQAYRDCRTAIKTIDKPNLHRLRDLAHYTLPMLGHMSLLGELVLEKAHQSLKRAVKRSNNKDVHLFSLHSVALDDWQARLTSAVGGVYCGDESSILHCYRLLSGREAVASLEGKLTQSQKREVLRALGPASIIQRELENQGKSVLSPRHMDHSSLTWRLLDRDMSASESTFIRNALQSHFPRVSITIGSSIRSSLGNGTNGPMFCHGDIVETLCFRPDQASFHYPFVLQANCSEYLGHLAQSIGPSVWLVQCAIVAENRLGGSTFYLAVRPCTLISENQGQYRLKLRLQRYAAVKTGPVSFAKIDYSMRKIGIIADSQDDQEGAPGCSSFTFFALTRETGYPPRKG